MQEERDFNDPRWRATRFAAFKRDFFQCRKCGQKKDLERTSYYKMGRL